MILAVAVVCPYDTLPTITLFHSEQEARDYIFSQPVAKKVELQVETELGVILYDRYGERLAMVTLSEVEGDLR